MIVLLTVYILHSVYAAKAYTLLKFASNVKKPKIVHRLEQHIISLAFVSLG